MDCLIKSAHLLDFFIILILILMGNLKWPIKTLRSSGPSNEWVRPAHAISFSQSQRQRQTHQHLPLTRKQSNNNSIKKTLKQQRNKQRHKDKTQKEIQKLSVLRFLRETVKPSILVSQIDFIIYILTRIPNSTNLNFYPFFNSIQDSQRTQFSYQLQSQAFV